jgi:hypothetical protein
MGLHGGGYCHVRDEAGAVAALASVALHGLRRVRALEAGDLVGGERDVE